MSAQARRRRLFRAPPRRAIPTRAGLFVLASPLVLGVAAVSATNNLLFMLLAAAMVTIVVSGVWSERNMQGVEVRIRPLNPVYRDEPAALDVVFSRPAGRVSATPAYGLTVREHPQGVWPPWRAKELVSPRVLDAQLAVLDGRQGRVVGHRTFQARGRARLAACELVTTYPFALLNKARDIDVDLEIVVRPAKVACPAPLADPRGLQIAGDLQDRRGLGLEVYGLRERQVWDSIHRIHARRSLALGTDVVLELAGAEQPAAWLGVAAGPDVDPDGWERSLEVAQSVLIAWHERGYVPGLSVGSVRMPPGASSVDSMLDALAAVTPEAPVEPGPGLWLVPVGAAAPSDGARSVAVGADGSIGGVR